MSNVRFSSGRRLIPFLIGGGVVLLLAVLLLPSLSKAVESSGIVCSGTTLDASNPAVTMPAGLTVALSDTKSPVTFNVETVEQAAYETSSAGEDLAAAQAAQPAQLVLRSSIYQVKMCGNNLVSASLALNLPDDALPEQTFDLYGWDGNEWSWLGAYTDPSTGTVSAQVEALPRTVALFQSTSLAPAVATQVRPGQKLSSGAADTLTEAYVLGWTVIGDGSLVATAGELPNTGKAKLYAVVQSLEAAPVQNILASAESTEAHLKELLELAGRGSFEGLTIDYRGLSTADRAAYTAFIQKLAAQLHDQQKTLSVVLPAPAIDANGMPDTAGYDWVAIGKTVDSAQADFGQDPANYLPGKAGYALVDWAPTQIDRYKFQPIFSVASLATTNGVVGEVPFAEAIKPIGEFSTGLPVSIAAGLPVTLTLANPTQISDFNYDPTTQTYRFKYVANGATREVVVKTARTLAHQLETLVPRHMRGAIVNGLEGDVEPASLAQVLKGYRQQAVPQNLPSPLDMQWKITLANGEVLTITRPITDTTYVWTPPAQAGNFTIQALVGAQPHGETKAELVTTPISETVALTTTGTTTNTMTASATVTATPAITATAGPCLSSKYLADVTIPDGTKLKNGEKFKKTWKVRNDGTCEWPETTALVYVSGEKMATPEKVDIGKVAAGSEVEVSVELTAPDQYGNFTGLWQLRNGQQAFGTQLSAVIVAGDPPATANVPASQPGAPAAPPVVAPGARGSFELGGHVDGFRRPDLMKKAGMNWIKVQTFAGGDAAGIINMAHNAGFKVLLGVLGDKSRVTDPGYQQEYANSVASMARAGADAIEVWNEPNIDREWPTGQVSGATYTQLLAKAYNAIKGANPGTMVVSAALAPTGFFAGGCQAGGCNDDVFLQQMAAAGAANYMDCVGAHHNSGATAPSATSGHPAAYHYSWYFLPTLNLYYGAFGGARKVCFTEFGYLTHEGYPSLASAAPSFAWADNTTLAQQAAWLAEAAAMSINSGKVRLMIIWNVDFTNYDSDPMAGYAIIRPGDNCPACDSLGAVVGSR